MYQNNLITDKFFESGEEGGSLMVFEASGTGWCPPKVETIKRN